MSTFGQPTTLPHLATAPRNAEPVRPEPQFSGPVRNIPEDQAPQRHEPVMSDWSAEKTTSADAALKCGGCEPTLDIAPAGSEKTKTRGKAKTELHARLDSMSHKRLKIAAAQLGRSQQELVTAAIDAFLDNLEDNAMRNCRCMQNARG